MRTASIAGDDLNYFDAEVAGVWSEIAQRVEDTIILCKERFLKLSPALKRHLLRRAIEELLGNLRDIETRHIEAIIAALTKPAGKGISLPGGLVFSIEYDRYLLAQDTTVLSPFPILETGFTLKIPGETLVSGWRVEAKVVPPKAMQNDTSGYKAYLDLDKAGDKLTVRPRRPGDRFQPLGMGQPKKLGEFMIDAKIPQSWRQRIPLVCSPQHILWVVGWRIDERVKVTEDTKQILCLKFEQNIYPPLCSSE
jgi:tRNA(Ile)-lysidine synthase